MRPGSLLLKDALESAAKVVNTTPATKALFDLNELVQSHVLHHIQIIGEACWRISKQLKDKHPEVPWSKIAGMRHVLVHDYYEVNWDVVYQTAREHVPALIPQIESILTSLPPGAP